MAACEIPDLDRFLVMGRKPVVREKIKVNTNLDWAEGMTPEIQAARLKVLIFIYTRHFGYGPVTVTPNQTDPTRRPSFQVLDIPLSRMKVLGYPDKNKIWRAVRDVRALCLDEAKEYRFVMAERGEAEIRFNAARFETRWKAYTNRNGSSSLKYQSKVAEHRGKGNMFNIRKQGKTAYKYTLKELLPRHEERERARREMQEADEKLEAIKNKIFEKMGVPPQYRRLA